LKASSIPWRALIFARREANPLRSFEEKSNGEIEKSGGRPPQAMDSYHEMPLA
jgi:hypothetical protein